MRPKETEKQVESGNYEHGRGKQKNGGNERQQEFVENQVTRRRNASLRVDRTHGTSRVRNPCTTCCKPRRLSTHPECRSQPNQGTRRQFRNRQRRRFGHQCVERARDIEVQPSPIGWKDLVTVS